MQEKLRNIQINIRNFLEKSVSILSTKAVVKQARFLLLLFVPFTVKPKYCECVSRCAHRGRAGGPGEA